MAKNESLTKLYVELLKDLRENDKAKLRIVAQDEYGDKFLYNNSSDASRGLGIHSSIINRCCKGEPYYKHGTSKVNQKKYTFYYEGSEPRPDAFLVTPKNVRTLIK